MEKLIIKGGTRLQGTIPVSGCKNAVLPIAVAAAILGDGASVLHNVPNLTDVKTLSAVLEGLGATTKIKNDSLYIEPINHLEYEAPYELVRKMRASIYVLGPLLAKLGKAKVSFRAGVLLDRVPSTCISEAWNIWGQKSQWNADISMRKRNVSLAQRCISRANTDPASVQLRML